MNSQIKLSKIDGGVEVQISNLPINVKETRGNFTAVCELFRSIGFSAKSKDLAITDLEDSLNLFFEIHLKEGTLDDALKEFGWEMEMDIDFLTDFQPKFQSRTVPIQVMAQNFRTLVYA